MTQGKICTFLAAMAVLCAGTLFTAQMTRATDPRQTCGPHDGLAATLTGKPHFERQVLKLQDAMPGQGHLFELFMSRGPDSRHSYTLLRTRKDTGRTCIVSAGLAEGRRDDDRFRAHIRLRDENDPDIYTIVTCKKLYMITRSVSDESLCDKVHAVYGTRDKVASYGRIMEDHRDDIPWLH